MPYSETNHQNLWCHYWAGGAPQGPILGYTLNTSGDAIWVEVDLLFQFFPKVVCVVRCFSASFTDLSATDPGWRTCVTPARPRPWWWKGRGSASGPPASALPRCEGWAGPSWDAGSRAERRTSRASSRPTSRSCRSVACSWRVGPEGEQWGRGFLLTLALALHQGQTKPPGSILLPCLRGKIASIILNTDRTCRSSVHLHFTHRHDEGWKNKLNISANDVATVESVGLGFLQRWCFNTPEWAKESSQSNNSMLPARRNLHFSKHFVKHVLYTAMKTEAWTSVYHKRLSERLTSCCPNRCPAFWYRSCSLWKCYEG